ncbi:hypothetical protein [Kurlavirus BKC-1]|nr:hypothetical protein [Kurlavirus BKC-1]
MYKFLDKKSFISFSLVFGNTKTLEKETKEKKEKEGIFVTTKSLETFLQGTDILHGPSLYVTSSKRKNNGEKCWREDVVCTYFRGEKYRTISKRSWFFISNDKPILWRETISEGPDAVEKCIRSLDDKQKMESFGQLKTRIQKNVFEW